MVLLVGAFALDAKTIDVHYERFPVYSNNDQAQDVVTTVQIVKPYSESQRAALAADNTQLGFVSERSLPGNVQYRQGVSAKHDPFSANDRDRTDRKLAKDKERAHVERARVDELVSATNLDVVKPERPTWPGQSRGSRSVSNSCAASRHSSALLANCLAKSSLFSFDFEPPETWTITALLKLREKSRTSPNGPVRAA